MKPTLELAVLSMAWNRTFDLCFFGYVMKLNDVSHHFLLASFSSWLETMVRFLATVCPQT
jgi:hypothetical protein